MNLRHWLLLSLATSVACARTGFGVGRCPITGSAEAMSRLFGSTVVASGLSPSEGVAGWSMSVLVKQDPGCEREDDHQARVDNWCRADVWFQIAKLDERMRDQRQRQAADDADHPRREVRAKNVHRQGMLTGNAHCHETKKENDEAGDNKLQNCSNGSHLSNDFAAPGDFCVCLTTEARGVLGEGRAKSPTLNASALAVVKIAACVS